MAEGFAMRDLDYLRLLSREYPTVRSACSEIINLRAIMGLPKGTEIGRASCRERVYVSV